MKKPILRFSPTAWAKLLYFRDKGYTEIGGFGITSPEDLLLVKDFVPVKQTVTAISVKFDDDAIADFFDNQVDMGNKPEQFARIWCHSHPADCHEPSITDEETFKRVFGNCQWAVMMIIAKDGKSYARLSFNIGPGGQMLIPVAVDYACEFDSPDFEKWETEFKANIIAEKSLIFTGRDKLAVKDEDVMLPQEFLEEFALMSPEERQFVLDELALKPELWNDESEVFSL